MGENEPKFVGLFCDPACSNWDWGWCDMYQVRIPSSDRRCEECIRDKGVVSNDT